MKTVRDLVTYWPPLQWREPTIIRCSNVSGQAGV